MIDFDAIGQAIFDAAVGALGQGAEVVGTRAKQLAPVRNIFGAGYDFRTKTPEEFSRDLQFIDTKTIESMAEGGIGHFGTTVTGKRPPRQWHERRLSAALEHLAEYEQDEGPLTRQGAYEVRSKRAGFSTWGHTHIGGRLRGEITAMPVSITGNMAEAWVISPTPYAKYQEFGTRHNRAHPFLRPAAEESRDAVVQAIAAAVKEASQQGGSSMEIEVVVRL